MKTKKITQVAAMMLAILTLSALLASCSDGGKDKETDAASSTESPQTQTTDTQSNTPDTSAAETEPVETAPQPLTYDSLTVDHEMALSYAKNFSVTYYNGGFKLISVADGSKLLVVPEGRDVPENVPDDVFVLRQPVTNIMISSNPTASLINAIGALDSVTMTTTDTDAWYIDDIKSAMTAGKLSYIGEYDAPDYERISASGCTLAIYSGMLTDEVKTQLNNLGVHVLLDMTTEEEHPLARVEWVKLYGAMFDLEDKADEVFDAQEKYVDEISKLPASGKTVAMFYITSSGKLYARKAGDYMTKMLELAGGTYILSDVGVGETGTVNMEAEAFYDAAKDADYIIYIWSMGGKPETLADMLSRSEILSEMKAVRDGNVWCTTPDYFQISDTLGSMINDMHLMFEASADTDALTYLVRLK